MDVINIHDVYLEQMSKFRLPDTVIATKATADGPLCEGEARDIDHHYWAVQGRLGRERLSRLWFDFDTIVDVGGRRLSDPHLRVDYMVKKTIALISLGAGRLRARAEKNVLIDCQEYDRFVRWRLSKGITQNGDLEYKDFEKFYLSLAKDVYAFLPIEQRLDKLFVDFRSGKEPITSLHKSDNKNHRQYVDWDFLSHRIGVTKNFLSTSRTFIEELVGRLVQFNHPIIPSLVKSLRREKPSKKKGTLSESHGAKFIPLWKRLYDMSVSGDLPVGGLTFDPYKGRSLASILREIELRAQERTKTLKPDDFMRLLQEAAKWAFEYSDYILTAIETRRNFPSKDWYGNAKKFEDVVDQLSKPDGAPHLHHGWHIGRAEVYKDGRISLGTALKLVLTACGIIVACFSARRGGEIEMLMTDCLSKTGALHFLRVYIEKTLQRIDKIPVPPMVASAVEVVRKANRQQNNSLEPAALFDIKREKGFVKFNFTESLKLFTDFTQLPPPTGETEWDLASHQLRRGFAVYYYYGNDWFQLDALAYMMRHFDPEMTRVYITEAVAGEIGQLQDELRARSLVARRRNSRELDEWITKTEAQIKELRELGTEFNDVRVEAYVYRMLAMFKGEESPIGLGVERIRMDLATMIDAASADVRIGSASNNEDDFLEKLIARLRIAASTRFLEPVPGGVAHCTANLNGDDDLSLGECNKLAAAGKSPWTKGTDARCDKVNVAFSGAYPCLTCIYGVLFKGNQRRVDVEIAEMAASVETAPNETDKQRRRARFEARVLARRAAVIGRKV